MPLEVRIVNPYACAGAVLTGLVTYTPSKDTSARYVRVLFSGSERTAVRYTRGTGDNRKTYTARDSRELAQQQIFLWGADEPGDVHRSEVLKGGETYRWGFQFQLPSDLPSSMNVGGSSHARIAYTVMAHVNRVNSFKKTTTVPVFVHGRVPHDALAQPAALQRSTSKDVGGCASCWCASGVAQVTATLNASIFLADDATQVEVDVMNNTTRPITSIKVLRVVHTRWNARDVRGSHHASRKQRVTIAERRADDGGDLLAPGQRGEYTIAVPLQDCAMTMSTEHIDARVELEVVADVAWSSDAKLLFPIVVAGLLSAHDVAHIEPQYTSASVKELVASGADEYTPRRHMVAAPAPDAEEDDVADEPEPEPLALAPSAPPSDVLVAPPVPVVVQPLDGAAPIAPIFLADAAPSAQATATMMDPFAAVDAQPLPLFTVAQPVRADDKDAIPVYN